MKKIIFVLVKNLVYELVWSLLCNYFGIYNSTMKVLGGSMFGQFIDAYIQIACCTYQKFDTSHS